MAEYYPIPITALAQSDADGTNGSNIVAGAVITVQDLDGNTVIMYDDDAGSGAATSKTTSATGQKDIYVTPGEYNVYVNGTNPKRYSAGGKSALEVDTFANLELLRPVKTGQSFICQERANARYILQTSGYVALPGDVTFANGRVGALQIDGWANVRWFGVSTGNTDIVNTPLLFGAVERIGASGGGEIFIPNGEYRYTKAIRMIYDNVTIRSESIDTRMVCTGQPGDGTDQFPNMNCFLLGTVAQQPDVPYQSLNPITLGDESVETTASNDFSAGDIIFICNSVEYTAGSRQRVQWGQLNVVESVSSNTISLKYPVQKTVSTGARCQNMSNTGLTWFLSNGADTGEVAKGVKNCKILGGSWIAERNYGNVRDGGAAIDCVIDIDYANGASGVPYGNLFAYNDVKVGNQRTRFGGVELAYCCHNNSVIINNQECYNKFASISVDSCIWLNEGSRDNSVTINSLNTATHDFPRAVSFMNCSNNSVKIGNVKSNGIVHAFCQFLSSGTNTPKTEGNEILFGESINESTMSHYLEFQNDGDLGRNSVNGGDFFGVVTGAVLLKGTTERASVKGCSFADGYIRVTNSGAFGDFKGCHFEQGILPNENSVIFSGYKVTGCTSGTSVLLHAVDAVSISKNVTNADPFEQTSTIKANSFFKGDVISITLDSEIPATQSSGNKLYRVFVDSTTALTYTSNETVGDVSFNAELVKLSDSTGAISYKVYENNQVVKTEVANVTSVDFTSDMGLKVSVDISGASDTVRLRRCKVEAKSLSAGEL